MRKMIRIAFISFEDVLVNRSELAGGLILAAVCLLILAVTILCMYRRSKKKKIISRTEADSSSETTLKLSDSEATFELSEITAVPLQESPFEIKSAVINNKGSVRRNNEDNFCLNGTIMQREKMDCGADLSATCKDASQLYAICDGMGGVDNGEDASYNAVRILSERKEECGRWTDQAEFTRLLRSISDRIFRQSEQKGKKSGTTLAALILNDGKLTGVNVGDSRIYRMRNHKLEQLSLDHSKVQRMISMGIISPEEAKTHPERHVITQYLGMPSNLRFSPYYAAELSLEPNDIYLICSDGLTDMVDDSKIQEILEMESKPENAAQALVKVALENGGRDNVTVMLLQVTEYSEREK